MHALLRIIVPLLALVAVAPPLGSQTPPGPIVRVEGLRQISPHAHIIPDNSVPLVPNVGVIVGDRAALVIDTGLGPPNGTAVYEVAKKLAGAKPLYLVTTHVHPEHDLGAQAFPDTTKLIRSADQIKEIAESGLGLAKVFASRSPINADLLKDADFRKADITFERDYDLDLGGVHAKLTAMGAHVDRGPLDGPFAPGYYYIVFEDPDGIRLEVNFIPGKGLLAQDPPMSPSSDPNWNQDSGRPRF